MSPTDVTPYDALLLLSFGGPDKPEDVVPFLENVTRGRGIPRERLEEVGEHYFLFGGKSPINEINQTLLEAIRADLAAQGIDLPVYWGNRNWDPYLTDVVAQMKADGVTRVACFQTSAYSSYSSCRQYRENLADAVAAVDDAPVVDRLRLYWNHPGFLDPGVDAVVDAVRERPDAHILFVTHSIPDTMNDGSGPQGGAYLAQHRSAAAYVVHRVAEVTGRVHEHDLVFCSRSGPPQVPWLEPDVNDHLEKLAGEGWARWCSCRSGSSPTTWRSSTTSTPRLWRPPSGSSSMPCGCRPRAPTRGSWRWSVTCWSSGPASSAASGSTASPSPENRPAGTSVRPAAAPTVVGRGPRSVIRSDR